MARPAWFDKGADIQAVADHLQKLAETATELRFTPLSLPAEADLAVLHQAALVRVRKQLAISHAESDRILAQEVRAIDDLVRTANLLVERLREWYALHAPEATRLVTDAETLAKLVAEKGDRTAVMAALDQVRQAETSLGSDLDPADLAVLRGFAAVLAAVHESWHALEARVNDLMETVAPNVSHIVGPVLGARLIALSGGLNRLATWPAGTVQLLGAETALFRHIKEGTRPPKHGILFQHPTVHLAPTWQRGAIARALALATATAAKADAFTKNDLRPLLAEQVKVDMERIQRERKFPPARPSGPSFGRGKPYAGGQRRDGPRGPPRSGGFQAGPPRGGQGGFRRDGPPPGPSRQGEAGGSGWVRRDGPSRGGFGGAPRGDGPRREGFGSAPRSEGPRREGFGGAPSGDSAPREGFGSAPRDEGGAREPSGSGRREGGGGFGPREGGRRDGPRDSPRDGPRGPPRGDFKPRRKPAGAFRGTGAPAKPPGKGGE